jgi:hypothetical protein
MPVDTWFPLAIYYRKGLRISLSFDIILTAAAGQAAGSYEFLMPPPSQWKRFGDPPAPSRGAASGE